MSPMLLLVAIYWVMRRTVGNKRKGIRWTLTSMLKDIDFVDDIGLLSSNANHLQKKINDLNLEEVDEFTYLGSTISKSNATEKAISNRLQKAKSSFHNLNKIWRSSNIGEKTKIKLYQSNIL